MDAAIAWDDERASTDVETSLLGLCHDAGQIAAALIAIGEGARSVVDREEVVWVDRALRQARELARLCDSVLRPQGDEPFDLVDVARSVIDAHPSIELTVHSGSTTITGHRVGVRRAVSNVVDNAVRVSGGGPVRVVVTTTQSGDVKLAVHDSGPGFGHGPAGTAGVGLTIVRSVLEDHGAGLHIGRSAMLGGVRVLLTFPARAAI